MNHDSFTRDVREKKNIRLTEDKRARLAIVNVTVNNSSEPCNKLCIHAKIVKTRRTRHVITQK